jgi:hypothetical protein
MELSIIIASWNTGSLLRTLLRSLHRFPPAGSHEIIVVDNGSADETQEMLRSEFPDVICIRNDRNEGYARANNQGFRLARGQFVLLLGSDTEMIDDSIQRMAEFLSRTGDAGAVAARLLNPDGTNQGSCKRFPTLLDGVLTYLSLHRLASRYNMAGFDFTAVQEVDQPAASCLMIRRSVVGERSLFDERYTILYNDVDLCKRIRDAGWKIFYLGNTRVVHAGSQSTRKAHPQLRLEMYRNIMLYYFHRFGKSAVLFLLPVLALRLAIVNKGRCTLGLLNPAYLRKAA